MVKIWISLNALFILSVIVWSWQKEFVSMYISFAKVSSQLAVIFILLNLNLYFIFLIIRKSKNKQVRKTLAKGARKAMKLHISIAVTATSLLLVHGFIMYTNHPISMISMKAISGFFAIFMLIILLFTGYRRHIKASGFRRKSHIFMAFSFFTFAVIHIFI